MLQTRAIALKLKFQAPRTFNKSSLSRPAWKRLALAFSHITDYTLAGSPIATPYIGGFSYFVTSIAAPIASGCNELAGWASHQLEKHRLTTARTHCGRSRLYSMRDDRDYSLK